MNFRVRSLCLLLVCLLLTCCIPVTAMAEEAIQPERKASLTIRYTAENQSVPDAGIQIYYLASVDEEQHFTLTERFSSYPIELEHMTAESWKGLAAALNGYVLSDQLKPDAQGTTGSDGVLSFNEMKTGLYLVLGEPTVSGGVRYSMEPTIVCLPDLEEDGWNYDVTIYPKLTPIAHVFSLRVIKEWEDEGYEEKRPKSVTIKLFQNQTLYDTVSLAKEDDWSHRWNDLPELDEKENAIEWSVSEDPVEGYTTKIRQADRDFVVTNTYGAGSPGRPDDPTDPDDPNDPTNPDDPSDPSNPSNPSNPSQPSSKLPQTGQLWWPVAVMSLAGLCLIAAGTLSSRRKESQ